MSEQTTNPNPNPLAGLDIPGLTAKLQNGEITAEQFQAEMTRRVQAQVAEKVANVKSESHEAWDSWVSSHPPKGDFNYVKCSSPECKGHNLDTFPFSPEYVSSVSFKTLEDTGDVRTLESVFLYGMADDSQGDLVATHLRREIPALLCEGAYFKARSWSKDGKTAVTLDFQETEKSKNKESKSGSANTTTSRNRR